MSGLVRLGAKTFVIHLYREWSLSRSDEENRQTFLPIQKSELPLKSHYELVRAYLSPRFSYCTKSRASLVVYLSRNNRLAEAACVYGLQNGKARVNQS